MANDSVRERDVRALERAYDDAWTAGDLARLLRCFTPDAVIINPYGDLMTGVSKISEGLRSVMAEPSRRVHSSTIDAVYFVTGDVAVVDGHAVLDAGGDQAEADQPLLHRFTDILVNLNGAWRIAHVRAYGFIN